MNIQHACEACIDLAMHVSAEKKFGIPQKSREAFELLHANHVILKETATNMKAMVGFHNTAVHDDQAVNANILKEIIEQQLDDFTSFTKQILAY